MQPTDESRLMSANRPTRTPSYIPQEALLLEHVQVVRCEIAFEGEVDAARFIHRCHRASWRNFPKSAEVLFLGPIQEISRETLLKKCGILISESVSMSVYVPSSFRVRSESSPSLRLLTEKFFHIFHHKNRITP